VRVVVTGAAGFVGSHVAEAMANAGHEGIRGTENRFEGASME
jgi:nucleoside-diphosphate-sugar epimerase